MATVYVLKNGVEGFYTGDKYINSDGVFAVVDKNINRAKAYSSLSVAKKACARLNETIENGPYQFKIMIVEFNPTDKGEES